MKASEPPDIPSSSRTEVREITDDEVAFYRKNGWAFLPRLVAPGACRAMLARARQELDRSVTPRSGQELRQPDGLQQQSQGAISEIGWWKEWRGATREVQDPTFCAVSIGTMGKTRSAFLVGSKP